MSKILSRLKQTNIYQISVAAALFVLIIALVASIRIFINLGTPTLITNQGVSPQERAITDALDLLYEQTLPN